MGFLSFLGNENDIIFSLLLPLILEGFIFSYVLGLIERLYDWWERRKYLKRLEEHQRKMNRIFRKFQLLNAEIDADIQKKKP